VIAVESKNSIDFSMGISSTSRAIPTRAEADAKAHEVHLATESPTIYFQLKWLEMEVEKRQRCDGKYPAGERH
jgi:hypothetical protein